MARTGSEIYEFDEFRLDVSERLLLRRNAPVALPEKALETLHVLVRKPGHLVEKDEILTAVWGGAFVEENNLDKNVSILRRVLGEKKGGKKFIETVRGHGYRFVTAVKQVGAEPDSLDLILPPSLSLEDSQKVAKTPELFSLRGANQQGGNVVALARWRDVGVKPEPNATENVANEKIAVPLSDRFRRRLFIAIAVAAMLGITVLLANSFISLRGLHKSASAPPFDAFKIRRFSDNGSIKPAVISADGKFIAFTDRSFAVWLKNTATDGNIKITPGLESGERAMIGFSPDGSYLYLIHSSNDKKSEVLKLAVFGNSSPQKIAEDAWSQPSLSPDGKEIAFTRFNSESGIFSLVAADTDGKGERVITPSDENERFDNWIQGTAWSPDATRIACIGRSQDDKIVTHFIQLFRAADGTKISRIRPDSSLYSIESVIWLPDGDNLLVIGDDRSSLGQVYRYTISTENWVRITNDLTDYLNLSATKDSKTILATSWNNQSNLWVLPGANPTRARQITFGYNLIDDATGVSWTGDGRIVYSTNASGRWEIWIIGSDGSNQQQLTQNCAGNDMCTMPFVSPDNRYIVFQASRNGEYNIWRMDLDGANPVQLTKDEGIFPFVAPNGRDVIYVNKKNKSSTLWQISIEGGEPKQLNKLSTVSIASISPDGRQTAFFYYDQAKKQPWTTCVAPIAGDEPEKCFDKSRSFARWAADGKSFYYLAHDYSGIWKQALNGGQELFLEFPGERINNFAFSPDGRSLVVARSKPTQDILALVDLQ